VLGELGDALVELPAEVGGLRPQFGIEEESPGCVYAASYCPDRHS